MAKQVRMPCGCGKEMHKTQAGKWRCNGCKYEYDEGVN